ncbi:hypothetical protein LINGRAHAP2_LOCUS11003, partial [Linum grandiflorum]
MPHATREFYSTLRIDEYTSTRQSNSIRFELWGKNFFMSADELGQHMGFYTPTHLSRLELLSLATMEKQPIRPSNKEFWKTISIHGSTSSARNTKAREMNRPLLRLLRLLFRRSITARKQSSNAGVVNNTDMWIFYCLQEGLKIHLGDLLVGFFRRVLKMSGQVLFGGSYVARLVRRLDGALTVFG